ncbi:YHS domain-containing protein, partial [Salmonella enterica subsp. enterica serovar Enteritidis]|uniref:YHS domain-containing protein n=1 Tax=Salmonella enterica TaxID=28901 RepID=UPI0016546752
TKAPRRDDALSPAVRTERDPVCGMTVEPARAKHQLEHDGNNVYFCSAGCVAKFRADPARYAQEVPSASHASHAPSAARQPPAHTIAADDVEYT